ncbi:hypothetical protein GCM10007919_65650 [Rhizobium indigoferae]|nr:hypothetical protein GCM10007919_65650 [Rhizobium indigoferae]
MQHRQRGAIATSGLLVLDVDVDVDVGGAAQLDVNTVRNELPAATERGIKHLIPVCVGSPT